MNYPHCFLTFCLCGLASVESTFLTKNSNQVDWWTLISILILLVWLKIFHLILSLILIKILSILILLHLWADCICSDWFLCVSFSQMKDALCVGSMYCNMVCRLAIDMSTDLDLVMHVCTHCFLYNFYTHTPAY